MKALLIAYFVFAPTTPSIKNDVQIQKRVQTVSGISDSMQIQRAIQTFA